MALAMGANVIAIGRNKELLEGLARKLGHHERFSYVAMTGDNAADATAILKASPKGLGVEVYNDWAPSAVEGSPFFSAAIQTVRPEGRVVLSGAPSGHIKVPYTLVMHKNIRIIGKVIVGRGGIEQTIKMVESGVLKLGKRGGSTHDIYALEDHHEAFVKAKSCGFRVYTDIAPNPW